MGYSCNKLERATGTEIDNDGGDSDDVRIIAHTIASKGSVTLRVYSNNDNMIRFIGTKPHSVIRWIMRTAKGFETWRQLNLHYAGGHRAQQVTLSLLRTIMVPQWNADKHFTKQY
eukprot:1001858-Amphidinium_carterae.5